MSAQPLVLITGATGFLGFHVLVKALKQGYRVRAAVRSVPQAQAKLLATPSLKSLPQVSNLTFVEVPDIQSTDAYFEAVKGVDYVIHCASPLGAQGDVDYEKYFKQPAVNGTLSMLNAAKTSDTIRRLVITSSVVANRDFSSSLDIVTTAKDRIVDSQPPFDNNFAAYMASKVAALNAAEAWQKEHKPTFDIVHPMPGFIMGRNELSTTTEGYLQTTASMPINALVYPDHPYGKQKPALAIDIDDAAEVHVRSLSPSIQGNRAYGITYHAPWEEAFGIIRERFPKAVENKVFEDTPITGFNIPWDASETEQVFGFKFRPFKDTTLDVAEQWLALVGAQKA